MVFGVRSEESSEYLTPYNSSDEAELLEREEEHEQAFEQLRKENKEETKQLIVDVLDLSKDSIHSCVDSFFPGLSGRVLKLLTNQVFLVLKNQIDSEKLQRLQEKLAKKGLRHIKDTGEKSLQKVSVTGKKYLGKSANSSQKSFQSSINNFKEKSKKIKKGSSQEQAGQYFEMLKEDEGALKSVFDASFGLSEDKIREKLQEKFPDMDEGNLNILSERVFDAFAQEIDEDLFDEIKEDFSGEIAE